MAEIGEWDPLEVPTGGPKRTIEEFRKLVERSNNQDDRLAQLEKKNPDSPTIFWVSRNGIPRAYSINAEQLGTVL